MATETISISVILNIANISQVLAREDAIRSASLKSYAVVEPERWLKILAAYTALKWAVLYFPEHLFYEEAVYLLSLCAPFKADAESIIDGGAEGTVISPKKVGLVIHPNLEVNAAPNQPTFDGSGIAEYLGLRAGIDYWISRRGIGALDNSEFVDNPPFGFTLQKGIKFLPNEVYIIHFYPKMVIL